MKIGIITFHIADNYGALLQTYALQRAIKDLNASVEIINYRCRAIEDDYEYHVIPKFRKNVVKWFWSLLVVNPKLNRKHDNCEKFRKKYLEITDPVYSEEDRRYIQSKYDIIITGSDQIWNEILTGGKDDWYCFKRVENSGAMLISYGASVGDLFRFEEVYELYEDDLREYSRISVREREVATFLMQRMNRKIYKIADPTLLLERSTWDSMADKSKLIIKEKFLLYYDVETNHVALAVAKKIASEKKIRLVHFNQSIKMLFKGRFVQEAGPCEFLSLIKNADYIVTSSFHATVFSIVFKKQFVTIPHPKTGNRVRCLLEDLKLTSRIVYSLEDCSLDLMDKFINYSNVEKRLDLQRSQSISWLKSSLG